jgi:ferrochelatase
VTRPLGVVVMAYGTPASHEAVEAFYTDVRRGRPPSPEQLADLKRRYAAVGGTSQLAERTRAQVERIAGFLEEISPGGYICRYGSKHAEPKIEQAVEELAGEGVGGILGLVLAPHYSAASVGQYIERARAQAASCGLGAAFVEDWHDNPVLIELLAEAVQAAYGALGVEPSDKATELLVTAHSLPLSVIESGDGYDTRLAETAELVATVVGAASYQVCWQSAGRTPEPWIGPDILEVIRRLSESHTSRVVVCPAGFTSDHLEVNYDVDIEARQLAERVGLELVRTASLNDNERLCAELARLVSNLAAELDD